MEKIPTSGCRPRVQFEKRGGATKTAKEWGVALSLHLFIRLIIQIGFYMHVTPTVRFHHVSLCVLHIISPCFLHFPFLKLLNAMPPPPPPTLRPSKCCEFVMSKARPRENQAFA